MWQRGFVNGYVIANKGCIKWQNFKIAGHFIVRATRLYPWTDTFFLIFENDIDTVISFFFFPEMERILYGMYIVQRE